MTESDSHISGPRDHRALNQQQWEALLAALDVDRDIAGQKYEDLRRRLMNLFSWEQQERADELADAVLDRLARRLIERVEIPHIDRFAFGIARLLVQEESRKRRQRDRAIREIYREGAEKDDEAAFRELQLCLECLAPDRRELIESYYAGDRSALAHKLGISLNTLRNRAMRVREQLFLCMSRGRDKW